MPKHNCILIKFDIIQFVEPIKRDHDEISLEEKAKLSTLEESMVINRKWFDCQNNLEWDAESWTGFMMINFNFQVWWWIEAQHRLTTERSYYSDSQVNGRRIIDIRRRYDYTWLRKCGTSEGTIGTNIGNRFRENKNFLYSSLENIDSLLRLILTLKKCIRFYRW